MPSTGLHQLDTSIHETSEWLSQLSLELGVRDTHTAYAALKAALLGLRVGLAPAASAVLAAQLPAPLRTLYLDGRHPRSSSCAVPRALAVVEKALPGELAHRAEEVVSATLSLVCAQLSRRQNAMVRVGLSDELRRLWPDEEQRSGIWPPAGPMSLTRVRT
jgi:uncharacterized protein (DUF2267 family)